MRATAAAYCTLPAVRGKGRRGQLERGATAPTRESVVAQAPLRAPRWQVRGWGTTFGLIEVRVRAGRVSRFVAART